MRGAFREVGPAPLVWAGVASLAVVAIGVVLPGLRSPATLVYVVVLGMLSAWALIRLSGPATRPNPGPFEAVIRVQRPGPAHIDELESTERLVRLSVASAFDLRFRLKPVLREIARERLMLRRGVDLDARPDEGQRILGDAAWQLIQIPPGRPEHGLPGVPLAELEHVITQLERI
jgi:hypothetical protein